MTKGVPAAVDEVVLVVGMSAREVSARTELAASARALGGSLAFLQLADPSVSRELTRLADGGHGRIVVIGVSLGSMAPAASWLRRIAAAWWRERGPGAPTLEIATALASGTSVADLELARAVLRPLTGNEAGLTSPAWEDVPEHRYQVLLCRGPRCSALGSDASAEAMILALMRAGLGDDDVLLTHTGCQFPCNQAPVISVQPDDVWYGAVDPAAAERIVAEHLVAGKAVEEIRLPRG